MLRSLLRRRCFQLQGPLSSRALGDTKGAPFEPLWMSAEDRDALNALARRLRKLSEERGDSTADLPSTEVQQRAVTAFLRERFVCA